MNNILQLFPSPLFFFSVLLLISTAYGRNHGNETDREALFEIKAKITNDPLGFLSSWNHTVHFCQWHGVTCGRKHQRVVVLNLGSEDLGGSISPYIGNLSFLTELDLDNNSFTGEIPSEIGRLQRLKILSLYNNSLTGEIPRGMYLCSNLVHLNLYNNQLGGEISGVISSLYKLEFLDMELNNLTGRIPPSVGNLSSLYALSFGWNHLFGTIPESMGQIRNLTLLGLSENHLSGTLPISIFNLSSLTLIDVGSNQLHGCLPADLFVLLPNLEEFAVYSNEINGSIPPSLSNASNLVSLQVPENKLTGRVPNFGNINWLRWMSIFSNFLGSGGFDDLDFFCSLANSSTLEILFISGNNLGGTLPECIGNFSSMLREFWFRDNFISGSIPNGIGNLIRLQSIKAGNNSLTGIIPQALGLLENLQLLQLEANNLHGQIPLSLGNLIKLNELDLSDNNLQGTIPSILRECKILQVLDLSRNSLNGTLPAEVVGLSSLSIYLGFSQNHLTGSIPREVGKLVNLNIFAISRNMLSGEIPEELGSCISLEYVYMAGNFFNGRIPSSLRSLRGLVEMNLSHNNLTGNIPEFFCSFHFLYLLDLSFNELEGMVPTQGIFENATAATIVGNKKLCGGIREFQLHACDFQRHGKRRLSKELTIIIATASGLLVVMLLLSLFLLVRLRKKRENTYQSNSRRSVLNVSYRDLYGATNGFCTANLVGVGSFGKVYKGILREGGLQVAVKVINLEHHGASKSFMAECEVLRNTRHRNLVKVLTACSSIDYQGNDFKALVYEFMVNGSLEEWLHPPLKDVALKYLTLGQRLRIAIDVASALEYLHGQCETTLVHCDIKPSNVLLDNELIGHVSDFGLAKFLSKGIQYQPTNQSSSMALRGTIGYAPPEYGLGSEVSTQGDTYSFGILLLELFTGKRPTDEIFQDGWNLHKLAEKSLSDGVAEIIDPMLLEEIGGVDTNTISAFRTTSNKVTECLLSIVEIGVACSVELPGQRMTMSEVSTRLCSTRNKLLRRPHG